MKKLKAILLIGTCLAFCAYQYFNESLKVEKPNVVFIMVDDLGWSDVGFMGSTYYETPNIDILANKSMVFTNAYAGAANCAPSRAALMSGMNSPRTGVFTVGSSERGKNKDRKLIPVPNTEFLADSVYTIAEMFKDAGYVTGHFGKWHVGEDPCSQGFDVNVGGGHWGHPKNYFAPYVYPEIEAPEGEYLTDRLTLEAVRFIEKNKSNPFFLYLPFYTVHSPLHPKEELLQKYKLKKGNEYHYKPSYAAMIETMDSSVGIILDKLQELNLSNTIVVFTSDNGGVYSTSKQTPLRAGKGSYYEGGVRVPLAISWPRFIKIGKTDMPMTHLDFYPTFTEIIGGEIKSNQPVDGISLKSFLVNGETLNERPLFFHFPIYLQGYNQKAGENRDSLFRTRPGSSIRMGDWKLLYYYEDQDMELFNLKDDPGEKINVANIYPEKREQLKNSLEEWIKKTKSPVPTQLNSAYSPTVQQ